MDHKRHFFCIQIYTTILENYKCFRFQQIFCLDFDIESQLHAVTFGFNQQAKAKALNWSECQPENLITQSIKIL